MTVYSLCGRIGLEGFFVDSKSPKNYGHTAYGVHYENKRIYTIEEVLGELPKEEMDVLQLNELFYRFDRSPEGVQRIYDLTLQLKEPGSVKGMINLMERFSEVCVVSGIRNERQLGELLVENELFDASFPDEVLPYLSYAKIGREHIQAHQGKLVQGAYVEDTSTDSVNQFSQESNEENDQGDDYEMRL